VVDHHDSYTHNLVHLIAAVTDTLPVVVEHDEVAASDLLRTFTHIVLSPGPGHPEDPADFAVGRLLLKQDDIPVLGVCLGMQGLVCAYGGRVAAVEPAHGEVVPIRHTCTGLFSGVPAGFRAVRYHSLAAVNVPYELRVTARTDDDVVMAVEHRWKPLFGVQFHPESILTEHGGQIVSNFMSLPSAGRPLPRPL
jgi:anthranilate synthase component 2